MAFAYSTARPLLVVFLSCRVDLSSAGVTRFGDAETWEGDGFCVYTSGCGESSAVALPPGEHGGFQHTCWQRNATTGDRTKVLVNRIIVTARTPPSTSPARIRVLLDDEYGRLIAGTSHTFELTSVDQSWELAVPALASFWVDLRSFSSTNPNDAHLVTYTIRYMAPGVCPEDLPEPCEPWTSYTGPVPRANPNVCATSPPPPPSPPKPPPSPPRSPGSADGDNKLTLILALSLGLGVPLLGLAACLCVIVRKERQGQPIFVSLTDLASAPQPVQRIERPASALKKSPGPRREGTEMSGGAASGKASPFVA